LASGLALAGANCFGNSLMTGAGDVCVIVAVCRGGEAVEAGAAVDAVVLGAVPASNACFLPTMSA